MRIRMKRTTKQYIVVACICTVIMGGAAAFTSILITDQIKDKYELLLDSAHREMAENKRTIYVAVCDINTGDFITRENVTMQTVYSEQPADSYIGAADIGKVTLIDIRQGTQMLKGMLSGNTVSSELREVEYDVIQISSNIMNEDCVDIRLEFPNGESYIVLSKKIIKGYTGTTTTCCFWMSEEELLRMSAAIVDAGLYTGSSLYVTKYIEPNIQEASRVNYTPSLAILSLLESDPNVLERASQKLSKEIRKSLENRLADSIGTDVTEINWDVDPNVMREAPNPTPLPTVSDQTETSENEYDINLESGQSEKLQKDLGNNELGSSEITEDYFYYVQEEEGKEKDIEYGE